MNRPSRLFGGLALASLALLLAACARPADPKGMTMPKPGDEGAYPASLAKSLCVRKVTGGEETNPVWRSQVDDEAFATSLRGSLENAGLSAPEGSCRYSIEANILGLDQPGPSANKEVTAHVNYKVRDKAEAPVLLETVTASYTAKFSDALLGAERLRLANQGAMRKNIGQFMDKLKTLK